MEDYTSLLIKRVLEFAWVYYPNDLSTGFGISKGYFSFDELEGKMQIVEDGKSKRPKVQLGNITFEDEFLSEAAISFSSFAELQNTLTEKGCPLAVDSVTSSPTTTYMPYNKKEIYTGIDITVPSGFSGIITNLTNIYSVVTFTVSGTNLSITGGVDNGELLLINGKF